MTSPFRPPGECPVCGADVPRGARACPSCGADERAGWDEEAAALDGLDLPGGDWEEEGRAPRARPAPTGIPWFWWLAAIAVLAVFLGLIF